MAFLTRARRMLAQRTPARLDYDVLVATLEAVQSSSAAARAEVRSARGDDGETPGSCDPLVEILLAQPEWPDAIAAQHGSFHRAAARPE